MTLKSYGESPLHEAVGLLLRLPEDVRENIIREIKEDKEFRRIGTLAYGMGKKAKEIELKILEKHFAQLDNPDEQL